MLREVHQEKQKSRSKPAKEPEKEVGKTTSTGDEMNSEFLFVARTVLPWWLACPAWLAARGHTGVSR